MKNEEIKKETVNTYYHLYIYDTFQESIIADENHSSKKSAKEALEYYLDDADKESCEWELKKEVEYNIDKVIEKAREAERKELLEDHKCCFDLDKMVIERNKQIAELENANAGLALKNIDYNKRIAELKKEIETRVFLRRRENGYYEKRIKQLEDICKTILRATECCKEDQIISDIRSTIEKALKEE